MSPETIQQVEESPHKGAPLSSNPPTDSASSIQGTKLWMDHDHSKIGLIDCSYVSPGEARAWKSARVTLVAFFRTSRLPPNFLLFRACDVVSMAQVQTLISAAASEMFKKPFKTANSNVTKGSDLKKIKGDICARLQIDPSLFDEKILSSKEKLIKTRLAGSHTIVYLETKDSGKESGDPLFIDLDGRNDFVPTVYTLWKLNNVLKRMKIHPGVFQYIQSGADLMLPGVAQGGIEEIESLKKNVLYSVVLNGSSLPIAVGRTLVDRETIQKNGMKGKGLECIHYLGDYIWAMGSQEMSPLEEDMKKLSITHTNTTPHPSEDTAQGQDDREGDKAEEKGRGEREPMTMDQLLEYCFFYAIKHHYKYPILFNVFWSTMISLPCRPLISTTIDMKQTHWKKLSSFLTEKSEQGIISIQEKSQDINRSSPHYSKYKNDAFDEGQLAENEKVTRKEEEGGLKIRVAEMFKPTKGLMHLFEKYLEKRQVITRYITEEKLSMESDRQMIRVNILVADEIICKKENIEFISKKEINELFLKKMQAWHQITRGNEITTKKGNPSTITITADRRQGNKVVTHIAGLESYGISPLDIAGEFNKMFAASTSVQQLPGKTAGKEVLVQGDNIKKIEEYLMEEFEIPAKYIQSKGLEKKKK
ncbi:hypothetical protein PROFUN_15643 [Planoprotostelium fungivorum]|uniref:SUI1 domain-containing protein n=1 Tax=Planoprotostelium fungivorum TaxID=1890364 RepID=A0A2P6MV53_9EUKA|nr:hypothetical protein PROFUN_15643 [Planoprotostelium fungivorum]